MNDMFRNLAKTIIINTQPPLIENRKPTPVMKLYFRCGERVTYIGTYLPESGITPGILNNNVKKLKTAFSDMLEQGTLKLPTGEVINIEKSKISNVFSGNEHQSRNIYSIRSFYKMVRSGNVQNLN